MVSFVPRPWRRSIARKICDPIGRARKASGNSAKEYKVPVTRSTNGKISCGNTSTEAIA